jgi:hypothetical protein
MEFFNGSFVESFDALVTSDGATITMTVEKSGGGDLTENFSSGQTPFDCTPAATIVLTPGTDEAPQNNYIYILQSEPGVLVKSTSGWPSVEHNKISHFFASSASLVNTGAPGQNFAWVNQNWNDNAADTTGQGHMADMAERLRRLPASWFSGCQGVATQDGNDLWVSIATGVVYQLHPHTFSAEDSDTAGAGDPIGVPNDPDANYAIIHSLNEITRHSDGDLIGNNKYVKFILWAVANKTGEPSPMMLNLPSEHYNTVHDARVDVEGYANFTMPAAFSRESSTGFLVAAFVCKHTATAMELEETIDLRGQTPTTASGSGTGGGDVSALAALTDRAIVFGDGGGKDVATGTPLIAVTGVVSIPGLGTGGVTDYDLKVGNTTTPDYGMIQMGDACIGRTSFNVGAINLDGTILCQNKGGPVTGDIEFIWTESGGGTARFALPKSGVGLATYNSRSMLLAGPAPADTAFVTVAYWRTQGIFDNLVCDTSGSGADLGVQNDLEVEGIIYADNLLESTTAAGITADRVVLQDGQVGLEDTDASHHLLLDAGSNLTADRVLSFVTGDAARTITLSGNPTLADWFDQAVKAASSPTFTAVTTATLTDPAASGIAVDGVLCKNSQIELGTDKVIQFRAADQKVYSSAASTLDLNAAVTIKSRIGGTVNATLNASGLTVLQKCASKILEATGDTTGTIGARTITNVTASGFTGPGPTLPLVRSVKESGGPDSATGWGWKKEYTSGTVDWIAVWR